jgi:beta-ureidopropionase / N-carbamoyl-L-amino-acid hydrolase
MIRVNPDRLLQDLKQLRTIGAAGVGVVRPALSAKDMEARHWLVGRMDQAGLTAAIDGLGTVFGRSNQPGSAVLIGSHTDTQPTGGWLDGTLGVIYGLEIARAAAESAETRTLAIDVAAWADEEGEFSAHLGSRAFIGEDLTATLAHARNHRGQSLSDALGAAGVAGRPVARFEPARHVAYVEPHIEQGGRLEAGGRRIGVVTSIVGVRELKITFIGQQNHAGTTPMEIRKDAGAALLSFASALNAAFAKRAHGRDTVWNIGRIEISPGSVSVVPGRAELFLQFRDSDPAQLRALEQTVADLIAEANRGPIPVSVEVIDQPVEPVNMDEGVAGHIAAAAEAIAPRQWVRMPSGACHDAQIVAQCMPAGMLFIPSIAGISHDPAEDTSEDDIVLGCRVAAAAVLNVLRGPG